MPHLRPFRGLRYDLARVPDLSAVLCPPYDVISPAERDALLGRDPSNAVRLELPSATPASASEADFHRAATTLDEWLADGTLRRDDRPLIYVYEQRYDDGARGERIARSFFCELRLEQYGTESGVRPHEHTMSGPREHRFQLLSAVRTHLSPVLLMYDDGAAGDASAALLDQLTARAPERAAIGPGGVGQRLWTADPDDSALARELLAVASTRPLTIADGHHRYETALRYRDTPSAPEGAQFVLALLYEAHSGGLSLAPWHRVIAGLPDAAAVLDAADELFDTRRCADADELLRAISESDRAGVLGLWTRSGGSVLAVDRSHLAPFVAGLASESVRWLDVSVLSGTLTPMIGSSEQDLIAAGRLAYTHDAREAVRRVDEGAADVCFLLRPTPVEQVLEVAAAGEHMPPKSTFFYPKAATGLVFDPLRA